MTKLCSAPLCASLLLFLASGCEGGDVGPKEDGVARPYLEDWKKLVDGVSFPEAAIERVYIGLQEGSVSNFHNRGDVEVRYEGDANSITVHMRRFSSATEGDKEAGEEALDKLSFWAYAIDGDLATPDELEAAGVPSCGDGEWPDACAIMVYFDGTDQQVRSGADFRVTLPKGYAQEVLIETEDNIEQDEYPNRGDVKIHDLAGSATVNVQGGRVDIKLADGISSAPTCSAGSWLACEKEEWNQDECDCYEEMGSLIVTNAMGFASNINIQVPAGLWATANLANEDTGSDLGCDAKIDCGGGIGDCTDDTYPDVEYRTFRTLNQPDFELVLENSGYAIKADSKVCQNVDFVNAPDEYDEAEREIRGFVQVCSDCADTSKSD